MELDIKNLAYGKLGEQEEVIITRQKVEDNCFLEPLFISGKVKLTQADERFLAEFSVNPEINLICDRCQEGFIFDRKIEFIRDFALGPIDQDSETLPVSKDLTIDIWGVIREEILLSIPFSKICKKDCLGLCAHCGADLNLKKCRCGK